MLSPDAVPSPGVPTSDEGRRLAAAALRALACTVVLPAAFYAISRAASGTSDIDRATDASAVGYFGMSAVALASEALLLLCLVTLGRARAGVTERSTTASAAAACLAFFAVALLFFPLAAIAFTIALLLSGPATVVAGVCVVASLIGVATAREARRAPSRITITLTMVAGWTVATILMPLTGGLLILSFST